ncbi:MAG: hypothetical protein DI565_10430 [Ancylobacter novellus]|uniref:Uncharacterized protein n=1 Tax=Ancylobacter novellus TaxID=921 RepID=A0A2W5KMN7_ANCNO|nr:MAG: hypothetical protein DI565_10430 [Ancylobacter novellus]
MLRAEKLREAGSVVPAGAAQPRGGGIVLRIGRAFRKTIPARPPAVRDDAWIGGATLQIPYPARGRG